uniref:NADH-ubiquinone oxidoreductase chain 5 n=1 Tax=Selaroides leptolepis TaxID=173311 RepID=A0A120L100_SELLE|nr:NADH dehydrogenase subunit 5 [Selaroides leptolepis]
MHPTSLMITSSHTMIFTVVDYPVVTSLQPGPQVPELELTHVKTAVMIAFIVRLFPLFFYLNQGPDTIITTWNSMNTLTFEINISLKFDHCSIIFTPFAVYVSWSILDFASWYMHSHPYMYRLFQYVLIFVIGMIVMVTANKMFQIFNGWAGVGIMSFVLLGWCYGRAVANTVALQAVLYNGVRDIGVIFGMVWIATNFTSWEIQHMLASAKEFVVTYPLLAMIVAATWKSAQFGLHPWLASAMYGATPVCALLPSSTIVDAGIFLLIRISPLMENHQTALTSCLSLGADTTFFTATWPLTHNDFKKFVAFSTSSQLDLMMVTIGLNQPQHAFLHICTHVFLNAILLLCSASIIDSLIDDQDIRYIGAMLDLTPLTYSCVTIGSLALTGTPFLAGFFSKDAIIESLNTSHLNAWALFLTLLATSYTAIYSMRMVFFVVMRHPRFKALSPINESNAAVINPIKRLAWGSIIPGVLITSNFLRMKSPVMTMPPFLKLGGVAVTILSVLIALELASHTSKQNSRTPTLPALQFSFMLRFFPAIMHRFTPKLNLSVGQLIASHLVEQTWVEKSARKAITSHNLPLFSTASKMHQGIVKTYLSIFFLTMIFMLLVFLP